MKCRLLPPLTSLSLSLSGYINLSVTQIIVLPSAAFTCWLSRIVSKLLLPGTDNRRAEETQEFFFLFFLSGLMVRLPIRFKKE